MLLALVRFGGDVEAPADFFGALAVFFGAAEVFAPFAPFFFAAAFFRLVVFLGVFFAAFFGALHETLSREVHLDGV